MFSPLNTKIHHLACLHLEKALFFPRSFQYLWHINCATWVEFPYVISLSTHLLLLYLMFQHNLIKKCVPFLHDDKLHFNELIPISSANELSLDIIVPAFHSEGPIPMPYPESFISNGPLKWPVFSTLVRNDPSILCHDCSHGCALRRQIYPIWSLFLKDIDRIPALEKLWPW